MVSKQDLEIKQQAYEWHMLFEDDGVSEAQRRSFDAWLESDPRHRDAYDRAAVSWDAFSTLKGQSLSTSDGRALSAHSGNQRRNAWQSLQDWMPRQRVLAFGTTAIFAMAIIAVSLIWNTQHSADEATVVVSEPPEFRSGKGKIRSITLEDGSSVTLAPGSLLTAAYSIERREIVLSEGAAIFSVVGNPERPFSVLAGDVTATALGTIFEVRNNGGTTRVAVNEGQVSFERPTRIGGRPTSIVKNDTLDAGEYGFLTPEGDEARFGSLQANDFGAWRDSRLNYQSALLAEIVADLNRYSGRPIVLEGDMTSVADLAMTGFYRSDNIDGLLTNLTDVFPVSVDWSSPDRIVISIND